LSLGNWLGGVWADKGGSHRAVGISLFLAGISALAILLLLPVLAGPLQEANLSLASTSLILALCLFFAPAALLGIITPLLTTLALQESDRPGHIVGLMHALAALGSIFGTFITGFYLVQWVGSRHLVLATGIILLLLSLPMFKRLWQVIAATTIGVAASLATDAMGYPDPCDHESNYFCIRVVDSSADVPFGEARSMVLDHLLHSTNHRQDPELLLAPYLQLMDELARRQTQGKQAPGYFFAGGGAYTLPRLIKTKTPASRVVVAELDPLVTDVAREKLYLDTENMEVRHMDARAALKREAGHKFDVVIGDVFHDIAIPQHLLTQEFAQEIKASMGPDGIYIMNVVDAFPDARLVKSVHKTLSQAFAQVDIWIDELPQDPTRLTFVISARDQGPKLRERIFSSRGLRRVWFNVTEPVLEVGTPMAETPVLSDDFAPVERLIARLFLGDEGK
ncbi:MAG: fused MFS/spermidine synthase, partial [Gammaproteobacteria bacterium]